MEVQKASPAPEIKTEHASNLPPPSGFDLPAGWTKVAVGIVSNSYAGFESQRYELSGNALGFDEQGDSSFFVYSENITNEFRATLILNQQIPIPLGGACGVMVRESAKSNAPFLFIGYTPSKIIAYRRDGKNHFDSTTNEIPSEYFKQIKNLYFRIQVDGKNVIAQFSYDPSHWQTSGLSNTIAKTGIMMAGMAISSGSLSSKVVAKFGAVSGN
jgi:hypothetical protein